MADAPTGQPTGGDLNVLKQKVGGIPVWVIGLAVGGGAAALLYFKSKTSSGSTTAQQQQAAANGLTGTSSSDASSLYPIAPVTYVTGVQQPTGTGTATPSTTGTIQVGPAGGQPGGGVYNTAVAGFPDPTSAAQFTQSGKTTAQTTLVPFGSYSLAGSPQDGAYPVNVNGSTLWILGENVASVNSSGSGGLGGGLRGGGGCPGSSVRYGGLGGLATPWQQMAQGHHVPGFWSGRGGRGGSLQEASAATGAPLERLLALNPFHQGGLVRTA